MQSILLHVILLIAEINGAVYLRRQRRKTDNNIETTNNNSLARTAVNKYIGFESESGSGVNSGSGLGEIYQNGGKLSFSTSSGSGARKMQRESEQMDESLQQLMNDNEDTSNAAENISFSGSGKRGSQHTEAESTDDVTGNLSFSGMSGRGSVDGSANQESFETADPVTEETYGSGGFEKKDGGDERPTISKRSLEKNDQSMTLLESFFAMNSNEDDSEKRLATSKRDAEQDEEEIEVKMRKRSVEDLGDETIPNLSYIKRDEENEKAEKFEDNTKSMEKRNVMDADNSVRFLDDMITRDLFNDKEARMIERITRGLNNDASSRDQNPIETNTHDISKQHHMNSVVSPRDEHKAKGISRDAKKQNGGSQNSKKHVKVEANKRENNLSRMAKRDAVGDRNINDRKYSKKDSANFKDTLKGIEVKRREILERIPVRSPHIGLLQKRDLILDSDTDADIFMASAGRTKYDMKEKRFVRGDDTPEMWRRPSQRYANFISDKITDLTPLNNEYLENMKRQNILMNKNAERLADKQVDLPLIGTFAKPTKVVGIWSGLGSEPVFIEKHYQPESDESGSGSGTVSDTGLKSDASGEGHDGQGRFKPEDVGNIMGTEVGNEMIVDETKKDIKNTKKGREESEKKRRKRMDKDEEKKYDVNKGTSQVVLAFDEVHEIVPKRKMMKKSTVPTNKQIKNVDKNEHQFTKKKAAKSDKKKNDESKEWNDDSKDADDGDWDDASGDEESGDEETEKHVRSDSEDDVEVKTLSAKYKKNEENYKRDLIIIKRAPEDNGYLGCFVDVLNPVRDLSVRAGIPFVTINNCRSACKRTGYYYAGLQFGYLCFCGNSYGKYDMAPDSECNYQCSGNGQQTCGGLWRNSIYSTAGSPDDSREGPVPIYLSAQDKANSVPLNTTNTRRSEIPAAVNTTTTTTTSPTLNSTSSYQFQATQQPPYSTGGAQNNDTGIPNNVAVEGKNESNEVRIDGGKRKVLMHFAYLHPQHDSKLEPTGSPLPTPPLRIEPQTRVFKGAIKLKQKWFDEFKDKMSTKSLILAGNVEQALKNIYTNNTQFHDFLKAEVLSFREGIIKNNPDTIRKVVVEFALTFNQNAISPDARLFSTVRAKKRLDEMPVYPSTLKVSEYRFDPNSPNQAFKIPVKESLMNADDNASDEDRRKSFIPLPDTANNQPLPGFQPLDRNEPSSQGIKELQSYLSGEASSTGQNEAALATQNLEAQLQQQQETGNEREISGGGNAELSKRANIPNLEESRKKIPYILRLFFWKDMLARKKRLSSNERIPPLTRERRGDLDTSASLFESNTNDNVSNSNRLNSRLDNNQQPLTQESSFERRFVTKTKRKTKDLTTEKELKRSKRLDQFESEFD